MGRPKTLDANKEMTKIQPYCLWRRVPFFCTNTTAPANAAILAKMACMMVKCTESPPCVASLSAIPAQSLKCLRSKPYFHPSRSYFGLKTP